MLRLPQWKAEPVTDILDDVEIRLSCPVENCPGEIVTTFGRVKADPSVTCPVCRVATQVTFSEEELASARAALPSADNAGAALDPE